MLSTEALKHWFWDSYDYLFVLAAMNVLYFVVLNLLVVLGAPPLLAMVEALPPTSLAMLLFLLSVIVLPIVLTMIYAPVGHFCRLISEEKDPGFRDLLAGLRVLGPRLWLFFFVVVSVIGVLLVNAWFYLASGLFPDSLQIVGGILAGLCFWLVLTLLVILQLAIPIHCRQKRTLLRSLQGGVVALLRYPGLLVGNFIFLVSLGALSVLAVMAPILLFGLVGPVVLFNAMYDVLVEHEEALEAKAAPEATTWAEIQAREKANEAVAMKKTRYNRTFRDVLRPWHDS